MSLPTCVLGVCRPEVSCLNRRRAAALLYPSTLPPGEGLSRAEVVVAFECFVSERIDWIKDVSSKD